MNRAYKRFVFTLLISLTPYGEADELPSANTGSYLDPECTSLVQYRDNELISDFNYAIDNYEIFSDVLLLAEENQASVDTVYNRFLATGGGEAFAAFAIAIKTTADVIGTALSINPATGLATGAKNFAVNQAKLTKIAVVGHAVTLVDEGAKEAMADAYVESIPYIGPIVQGIRDIADDLEYMESLPSAHKSAKAEFDKQMKRLKSDVSKYKNKLNQAKNEHYVIKHIKNQIETLCGKSTVEKSIVEEERHRAEKAKLMAEIQRMKNEREKAELKAEIQRMKNEIEKAELRAEIQRIEKEMADAETQRDAISDLIEGVNDRYAEDNSYSNKNTKLQTQCAQVVAQINQYHNVLSEYERAGQGAMIRNAIQQNQSWYNNNCL